MVLKAKLFIMLGVKHNCRYVSDYNPVLWSVKQWKWIWFWGVVFRENEKSADILSFYKGQEFGHNLLIYLKFNLVDSDY